MEQKKQTKQANEPLNIYVNKTNNHYGSTHRNNREARTILLKYMLFLHKQGQVSTQFSLIQPKYGQTKQTNHVNKSINAHVRQSKNTDAKNHRNYKEIRTRSQFPQPGQDPTCSPPNKVSHLKILMRLGRKLI